MKKDKQQPEKGQLTNEEYLDLYGSKDNMYLKARISTNEYFKLPEDKRRFYVRFCGLNEVFYTLNPMTSPFSVTIPKVEDQAPLSNETKAVESVTLIQEENKQCSHESLERITTTDGKYYEICHHCSLSFPKHPIIQDESAGRFLLKNRLNDICVSGLAAEPKIFASEAMRMYASQFKNTDAVKVITDRIEKLENNLAFRTHGWLGNKLKYQLQEAKDILKLIQP